MLFANRMPVLRLPVGADAPGDEAEHMAGQMRDLHPGRNEEARVVRQALQVAFARGAVPADEGVAVRALPRRRTEQHTGHRASVPVPHEVADILADRVALSEVVLVRQQSMEQARIGRAGSGDAHLQRLQVAQRAADRLVRRRDRFGQPVAPPVGRRGAPRGQPQMPRPFQFQQQRARRHVLWAALRVTPVPTRAQFPAQARAIPFGMRVQQAANRPHVRLVEPPPLYDHDACHARTVRQTPR